MNPLSFSCLAVVVALVGGDILLLAKSRFISWESQQVIWLSVWDGWKGWFVGQMGGEETSSRKADVKGKERR